MAERDFIQEAEGRVAGVMTAAGFMPGSLEHDFARAFFAQSLPDDTEALSDEEIARIARHAFEQAFERPDGASKVAVSGLNQSDAHPMNRRTIINLVNDDRPFIVDSISAELAHHGHSISKLLHPILTVTRDPAGRLTGVVGGRDAKPAGGNQFRESMVYIEIDRVASRQRQQLHKQLETIVRDVRIAVDDWPAMLARMREVAAQLKNNPSPIAPHENAEAIAFIEWLIADNFTLLGYRYHRFTGKAANPAASSEAEHGLGLLRDPDFAVWRGAAGKTDASPELRAFLGSPEPLLITKANAISTIHRRTHLDYIGVKQFNPQGRPMGEHRFVGLFTSSFYATSPRATPILRRKVAAVIEQCGFDPRSHAGKGLVHVLDTFPRDELIQIATADLRDVAVGMLSLAERPRPKIFTRKDAFERFVSVLAYIPREHYRAELRERLGQALTQALGGRLSMFSIDLSGDAVLARVHYIIATTPGQVPVVDEAALDAILADLVRGWDDALEVALAEQDESSLRAARLRLTYGHAFSQAYREQFSPAVAAEDILRLADLPDIHHRDVQLYRMAGDAPDMVRLKAYARGAVIPVSDSVPMIEHMGLKAIESFPFDLDKGRLGWVHDFLLRSADGAPIDLGQVQTRVEDCFRGVFNGALEDDNFNALVLTCGLEAEHVAWIRAIFRYLRQTGLSYGLDTVRNALARYPVITRSLIDLFVARHHPRRALSKLETAFDNEIQEGLRQVSALDDDRILRQYLAVIKAMVRTNVFVQPAPEAMAFKIRSAEVPGLPLPVPFMEIFVYSPRLEGVHLRGGKVARGGLRWSDRRDDFRTEILGLIKAQLVKNAVIVPVGAKGGFYPKQLPNPADRDAWLAEGTECYKIYIRALLSVTDNLAPDGSVIPPQGVVRRDEDDPYLVVAADKGTATFSDIANALALEHGFWLGDAFASGGSNGYDHKKMGITAKGAWISVQRHFREMGVDVQSDAVRVIGVGDMSGDVFGNGMLLSRSIRLVAAFDHRHIFLDPDPDPAASWAERVRLFALPRSSWADYDAKLISAGGGVHARSAKAIPLSEPVRAMLGVSAESLPPAELMHAILKMQADLFWLGGIGTYVKAAAESHEQAGDKANDAIRVDAEELRVKVIGEGANLGVTQRGRIAFATGGGRINTDFIDNSAGVDCSDNEVNIKILLNPLVYAGQLTQEARDRLLVEMTDDVGALVLRDNYLQTQTISIEAADAPAKLAAHGRLIATLEASGGLNRTVEQLPRADELIARAKEQRGLTRPELAVLVAYAKLALFDALVASSVPDAMVLRPDLVRNFPTALQERFNAQMDDHRLKREIISTKLANAIVNRCGPGLAFELAESTNSPPARIAAAFACARELFNFRELWTDIEALDGIVDAAVQTQLLTKTTAILTNQMLALVAHEPDGRDLDATLATLKPDIDRLMEGPYAQTPISDALRPLLAAGVPEAVVQRLAVLDTADAAIPIASRCAGGTQDSVALFNAYGILGEALCIDWLAGAIERFQASDPWEYLAVLGLRTGLMDLRLNHLSALAGDGSLETRAQRWLTEHAQRSDRIRRLMTELAAMPMPSLPMLVHAVAQVRASFS